MSNESLADLHEYGLPGIKRKFEEYTGGFTGADGFLPAMLQLKVDHSRRVAADMRGLALSAGWDGADVALADGLGLLHDIGRFEQYARFQTFRDAESVDHGELGEQVSVTSSVLADCSVPACAIIRAGIRHHNARHIPALKDARALDFLRLVRDADKLDIYHVLYQAWRNDELRSQPDVLHGVDIDGPPCAEAMAELRARHTISFGNVRSLTDFFLMQVSWVYDFNFPAAYRMLLDRQCIDHLGEVLPRAADIRRELDQARRYAEDRV